MATTRFKFRASSVSGKQGTLFIQVIHQRVVRQVTTSYKLYPKEWDAAIFECHPYLCLNLMISF